MQDLGRRTLSNLWLWALLAICVFSGSNVALWLLISVFGILAQREFYLVQLHRGVRPYVVMGQLGGGALYCLSLWFLVVTSHQAGNYWKCQTALVVLLLLGCLVRVVVTGFPSAEAGQSLGMTMLGFLYVPFLLNHVNLAIFWPGSPYPAAWLLLYLVGVAKVSDMAGYLVGASMGRHKMLPRISPKKTWEGFAAGVLASLAVSLALPALAPESLGALAICDRVALGLLLPLASVAGDLTESVFKRDAQVKDSGGFIPGIGGALDLVDSLLFAAPVLFYYLYAPSLLT